jgi:transmembrane sensor
MSSETPLRDALRDPIGPEDARRMWSAIDGQWRPRQASRLSLRLALAAAAMLGALALLWVLLIPGRTTVAPGASVAVAAAGPLALENGEALGKFAAPADNGATVRFNEGSHIELDAKAELDPLINAADAVTWLLSRGRITVDVKPGGPRRWSIECGVATVEVVGTRFTVDRDPAGVMIRVEHGVVLVRGERVPQRVQRLTAGDQLVVPEERKAPSEPPRRLERAASPSPPSTLPEPTAPSPAAELLGLSDEARAAGRPEEAARLLAELVRVHPHDQHAGEAAFILGKLRLDALGDAARAGDAFATAIRIGLPPELLEDAYVRLVEARSRAGDREGARAAAIAYDGRYPQGTRRGAIARWLSDR